MSCVACATGQPTAAGPCESKPCACCGQAFTTLAGTQIDNVVIPSLTGCVDQIRDIYTQFGARPYRVYLVRTQWSSGSRGVGVETVIREDAILPTPKVADISAMSLEVSAIGTEELGRIRVSEISPRFTEDQLNGLDEDGSGVPSDQSFYWEVNYFRVDGSGVRRRFTPVSAPNYNPTKFQWWIDLTRQYEIRSRNGDPNG
jgi:hypothetical protein